jgi:hypothetical protein
MLFVIHIMETKVIEKILPLIDCIILIEVKLWLKFITKFILIIKNFIQFKNIKKK